MFPAKSFQDTTSGCFASGAFNFSGQFSSATFAPQHTTTGSLQQSLARQVEGFLARIKQGRFFSQACEEHSGSLRAALEATKILQSIIEYYASGTIDLQAMGVQNEPESVQKKRLVQEMGNRADEVIAQVTNAGLLLQRAMTFKLMLTNVTRRVLCILRDALQSSTMSEADLHLHWGELRERLRSSAKSSPVPASVELSSHPSDEADAPSFLEHKGFPVSAPTAPESYTRMHRNPTTPVTPVIIMSQFAPRSLSGDHVIEEEETGNRSPLTDGGLLPRVTSAANFTLEQYRQKKKISFSKFVSQSANAVGELLEELDSVTLRLVEHAPNHIYANEFIVTSGCSHSTLKFLLAAAKSKKFFVVILEGAPRTGSTQLAESLVASGIECRVLPDSSCFAIMSNASKVFISTENVLANGGLLAQTGTQALCLAAQYHSVPAVVLATWLKLCPYYPSDTACSSLVKIARTQAFELSWSVFDAPQHVLPLSCRAQQGKIEVHNPAIEYVPPELLSLIVTDQGEYTPEDINRVVREQYSAEDAYL